MTGSSEELVRLGAVPLFEDLSKREQGRLSGEPTIINHEEGHTIVTEGRDALGFHLIRSGTARVVQNGRVLTCLGPGQFFGELALFDAGPRTATTSRRVDTSIPSILTLPSLRLPLSH